MDRADNWSRSHLAHGKAYGDRRDTLPLRRHRRGSVEQIAERWVARVTHSGVQGTTKAMMLACGIGYQ